MFVTLPCHTIKTFETLSIFHEHTQRQIERPVWHLLIVHSLLGARGGVLDIRQSLWFARSDN